MKKRSSGFARRLLLMLAVFAVLFGGIFALVDRIGSASSNTETELVRDAVRSAVLTCYAVEGAYPMTLEYLADRYGLAYNEEAYIVSYDAFATNVMPEIRVLEVGDDTSW